MTASPDTGTGRDTRAHVAAGHHTNTTTRGDLMTSTTPTAGGILAAADALQDPARQTFDREQVAYLMHLAYDAGRTATHLEDVAELHCNWEDRPFRQTYEQWVAGQIAEMERHATGDYRGGPVDFETGRPVRHLGAVA